MLPVGHDITSGVIVHRLPGSWDGLTPTEEPAMTAIFIPEGQSFRATEQAGGSMARFASATSGAGRSRSPYWRA